MFLLIMGACMAVIAIGLRAAGGLIGVSSSQTTDKIGVAAADEGAADKDKATLVGVSNGDESAAARQRKIRFAKKAVQFIYGYGPGAKGRAAPDRGEKGGSNGGDASGATVVTTRTRHISVRWQNSAKRADLFWLRRNRFVDGYVAGKPRRLGTRASRDRAALLRVSRTRGRAKVRRSTV